MRKGVYAFLKENSDGSMNINIEYSNDKALSNAANKSVFGMAESVTNRANKYSELKKKSIFLGERKSLLDGIANITSYKEYIRLISMLAKSCKKSGLRLYVFQDGKIIYTTDKDISLEKRDNTTIDIALLNKAATEAIVKSYK